MVNATKMALMAIMDRRMAQSFLTRAEARLNVTARAALAIAERCEASSIARCHPPRGKRLKCFIEQPLLPTLQNGHGVGDTQWRLSDHLVAFAARFCSRRV
jgi:hypothetical protein